MIQEIKSDIMMKFERSDISLLGILGVEVSYTKKRWGVYFSKDICQRN